jgi:hypothetical protein
MDRKEYQTLYQPSNIEQLEVNAEMFIFKGKRNISTQ